LGGECKQGHDDLLDCEFYELTEADDEPAPSPPAIRRIDLPSGEALQANELERVLAGHSASVVVLLGRVGAGKTTLISLAYHLLGSRRLPDWSFAGSKTIVGLARRSHYASFASNRTVPTTARTERWASGLYLHLGMRRQSDDVRAELLLVDVSGEDVVDFSNGKAEPVVQKALRRANHIIIVVDGAEIADVNTRSLAVFQSRTLLKMLEKQELSDPAQVCVVITKSDLLVGNEMNEVFDAISRGTLAEGSPGFVTADRESVSSDGSDPKVMRGDGVNALVGHIAVGQLAETAIDPVTALPPQPSPLLRRLWTAP